MPIMNAMDFHADAPAVIVRCLESDSAVRLCDRWQPDAENTQYAVEASDLGLAARVNEVSAGPWQPAPDLSVFFDELATAFRGRSEERMWHSMDHELTVSAAYRSDGHVGLTWTLRPWSAKRGGWSASVTTWQAAGERMAALADEVRAFLHP